MEAILADEEKKSGNFQKYKLKLPTELSVFNSKAAKKFQIGWKSFGTKDKWELINKILSLEFTRESSRT